jgi:hypothetical protein
MPTMLEYPMMAGGACRFTRAEFSRLSAPATGWREVPNLHQTTGSSGFEAIACTKGSEIVISLAGTHDKDLTVDLMANVGSPAEAGSGRDPNRAMK